MNERDSVRRPSRLRRRLTHNAIAFALALLLSGAVLARVSASLPTTQRASIALGYVSFGFLMAALAVGPVNVIRRRPNPLSNDLRRDLGLWAVATAIAHVGYSLQHHFGGAVAEYFFVGGRFSFAALRRDNFGISNELGVLALIIAAMLAAISNDVALRRLGRVWKSLQRFAYALAMLVVVHMVLYWRIEARSRSIELVAILFVFTVILLQLLGVRRRLQDRFEKVDPSS